MADNTRGSAESALPAEGCRAHFHHVQGCNACAGSYVARVRWYLEHPDEIGKHTTADLPKLDPTPCGLCGSVIGRGLMDIHLPVCPGLSRVMPHNDGYPATEDHPR